MVLLLSLSPPGRFDLIRGSATIPFVSPRFLPFHSASTTRKINSFTEQPAAALSP
jgi:hypothetical protein